jgi:hypothetical protein
VTIMGGGRYNSLTINKAGQDNFTVKDDQTRLLFKSGSGGSMITVAKLQRLTVIGDDGKPLYTFNAATVPSLVGPLLLGD